MSIHADMTIGDILKVDPVIAGILTQRGMHCISCAAAAGETLREACVVHGMGDEGCDELVAQINEFLGE